MAPASAVFAQTTGVDGGGAAISFERSLVQHRIARTVRSMLWLVEIGLIEEVLLPGTSFARASAVAGQIHANWCTLSRNERLHG